MLVEELKYGYIKASEDMEEDLLKDDDDEDEDEDDDDTEEELES